MCVMCSPHGVDDGPERLHLPLLQRDVHGRAQLQGRAGVRHALAALVVEHPACAAEQRLQMLLHLTPQRPRQHAHVEAGMPLAALDARVAAVVLKTVLNRAEMSTMSVNNLCATMTGITVARPLIEPTSDRWYTSSAPKISAAASAFILNPFQVASCRCSQRITCQTQAWFLEHSTAQQDPGVSALM